MNLSFRQLQTFVEVMRAGSVSQAGRSLGRTQPAISAMLSGLEEEIGFPLFERERGRLVPKPEAHYFMEEAEFVLARLSQSARTLQEIGNLKKGKLRLACNPAASSFFMPDVVARFVTDKPEIKVSLMTASSPVVTDWIASQQYDIGLAETPAARRTISSQTFTFPCLCAMPKNDALGSKAYIQPCDLDGRPLAMLYDDHTITEQIRAAFASRGSIINQRFELRTLAPAFTLVSEGLCYAICDQFSALSYQKSLGKAFRINFRPFQPTLSLSMALMTPANRPHSDLSQALTKIISAELSKIVGGSLLCPRR